MMMDKDEVKRMLVERLEKEGARRPQTGYYTHIRR